jgi:hypothetical protein
MLMSEPLPFVKGLSELDAALRAHRVSARGLSALQRRWLGFCLMAMMVTNSLCWTRFERAGLGRYAKDYPAMRRRQARDHTLGRIPGQSRYKSALFEPCLQACRARVS